MTMKRADIYFGNTFNGRLVASGVEVPIGDAAGSAGPYDLLLGALAGCLYATFLDVVEKKKGAFDSVRIHVEGEKRETIPTTLKWVRVSLFIKGAAEKDRRGMEKAAELAAKHCSIYQTVSRVADMSLEVAFE